MAVKCQVVSIRMLPRDVLSECLQCCPHCTQVVFKWCQVEFRSYQGVTSRLEQSRYPDLSHFCESIGIGLKNFGLEKSLSIGLENKVSVSVSMKIFVSSLSGSYGLKGLFFSFDFSLNFSLQL